MRIVIPVTTEYAEDFIQWLVKRIKSSIMLSLDLRNLYPFIAYQEKTKMFEPHSNNEPAINFESAIHIGIRSITYKRVKDNWIVYLPQNIPYEGYFTTISALCRFVDNGSSEVKGYPIFTNVLKGVATNISKYYNQFLKEFVL